MGLTDYLGKKRRLMIVKEVEFGVYLGNKDDKVLLPKKQVPKDVEVGDPVEVFLYKDSSDRLIATTQEPKITLDELAVLKVADTGRIGENDIVDKVVQAIKHHAGNFFLWPFFRHYRTHRPSNIAFELIGILPRYFSRARRARRDAKRLREFHAKRAPYFFFPLQLNSDSQIQLYSPYVRMHEAIADVLTSFAKHAPKNTHLLIKNHPLDNGLIDYDTFVKAFSSELGIADRVTFVDFGNTGQMVGRSLGVVLINSTVGIMALEKEIPVYCLGHSIYNIEGLAQSWPLVSLKDFWKAPAAPDKSLFEDFRNVVAQCASVAGNFYGAEGIQAAVKSSLKRFAKPRRTSDPDPRYAPPGLLTR